LAKSKDGGLTEYINLTKPTHLV